MKRKRRCRGKNEPDEKRKVEEGNDRGKGEEIIKEKRRDDSHNMSGGPS